MFCKIFAATSAVRAAAANRTWYPLIKNYSTCRENKNTKNNKTVLTATEIIFRFGGFICFVAKNNVFDALGFVACAIFFATGGVNRKLHKRQKNLSINYM